MDTPSSIERKHIVLTDKYYFAAYLNMARHNVYMVLTDINTRLGFEKVPGDDAGAVSVIVLQKLKEDSTKKNVIAPDIQLKIIKELHAHFSFLKPMMFAWKKPIGEATEEEIQKMEYAPGDYYTFFAVFLKALNDLRNEYTHVATQPFDFPADLLHALRVTFDAGVRKAKARFSFEAKDVEHLVRQVKGGKEKPAFKYKFQLKGSKSLTTYGLSFFICLLLERKYASLFTQKLEGLKDKRTRAFKATYEVFAVHCITLPKARYTSDSGEGSLLLDMLNELKRCPDILFPHLQAKNQDVFRIPVEDVPGMEQEEDNNFVLLKRYEDRFPYLALRFMDEVKWFQKLHFPVDLGNYHYHLYDKTVDGMPRVGSLWEKMIGYGRLPDYQQAFLEKKVPDSWLRLWKNHEVRTEGAKAPYIPPAMPHYHLPDNNIAIRITTENGWPDLTINEADADKNKPGKKHQPDMLISKYELFGLIFYGLLLGDADAIRKNLEDKLVHYVHERKRLYREIQNGKMMPIALPPDVPKPSVDGKKHPKYDLRKSELNKKLAANGFTFTADDLPDEIKCFLMGIVTESFEEKAKYLLRDLLEETEGLYERVNRQLTEKRKLGSWKDVEIKSGVLATFLAKDIMRFQPAITDAGIKANGKATSTLYKVLQAKLALYGANIDTLERTFIECKLIGGSNPHPFLEKVVNFKKGTIVDFYIVYLQERKKYLSKCQEDKKYSTYQWLKNNQARSKVLPDFGKQLAKNMLEVPVVIPRGFFTQGIKSILTSLNNEKLNDVLNNARTPNNSFMLINYLQHCHNDDLQEFYGWERVYKIFNNYYDQRTKKDLQTALTQVPLSEQNRKEIFKEVSDWVNSIKDNDEYIKYKNRFDAFESNEKQIRQVKVQDIALFLMSNHLLKSINKNLIKTDGRFYLKDISPNGDKGILDTPMDNFGRHFLYSCSIVSDAGVPVYGTTKIYQNDLKVKNIGDFNKFIRDRRLNNLLGYIQQAEINRPLLEKELERYDTVRVDIFKIIHDFESQILALAPAIDGKNFDNIIAFHQQQTNLPDKLIKQIKKIRDAFSHNEYPNPLFFLDENNTLPGKEEKLYFADYFHDFIKNNLKTVK